MRGWWWLVMGSFCLLASACGSSFARFRAGTFDANGYRHPFLEYRVASLPRGGVVSTDWLLENFSSSIELKRGDEYIVHRAANLDGDGRPERLGDHPAYDLSFRSQSHGGRMWVRTIPMPRSYARRELDGLMNDLIERISGTGVASVEIGDAMLITAQTFATRGLFTRPIVVDGREAILAELEVASVAQLQLSPDARWERVRLALVRMDLQVPLRAETVWADLGPGLLLVGYANRPDDYERGVADYDSLLSRIQFETPETRAARAPLSQCMASAGVLRFVWVGRMSGPGCVSAATPAICECVEASLAGHTLETNRSYGFRSEAMRVMPPAPPPTVAPVAPMVPVDPPPQAAPMDASGAPPSEPATASP